MLEWLYELVGTMLSWFSSLFGGTYAIALLLYALLFKLLFLPFSIKQQKNQIKMAKLTPKIQLIRAKYKGRNDQVSQQKMQQEIMEFQQKEGYSPFSGCLPLLYLQSRRRGCTEDRSDHQNHGGIRSGAHPVRRN